jgi:hypothetical protein
MKQLMRNREWFKGKCQNCGKTFEYLPQPHHGSPYYIPITCGKFNCLQEADKRNLFYKAVPEG